MRKIVFFSLSLAMILGLGFATNGVMAEDTQTLNDEDFEVEYLAAPAVAGELLEEAGIDNRYGTGRDGGNYIKDVAQKMNEDSDTNFNNVEKTDVIAYECAVAEFLNDEDNGDNYPAGVISQYEGVPDPDASNAEFTDNQDGTGTMSITVKDGCGNGIEELGMEDIEIDLPLVDEIKSLYQLDSEGYWDVSLNEKNSGEYEAVFTRLGSTPYTRIWGVIVDGTNIGDVDVKVSDVSATLQSVEYVGTCETFGTEADETLTFTFSNNVSLTENYPHVIFDGVSTIGTGPLNWSVEDGNNVVITTTGEFNTPRPDVGDTVTDFKYIVDSASNDVVVPEGGVKVVKVGGECLVDTVIVDSAEINGANSVVLENEQQYRFEVSETWVNKAGTNDEFDVDAQYVSYDKWSTSEEGPDSNPLNLQLQINKEFVDWGNFDTNHIYFYDFNGEGETVNFRVFDGNTETNDANSGWYGDNEGSLTVEIYEVW